jgi:hypothetical protein
MPLLVFCLCGAVAVALVGVAASMGLMPGLSVIPAALLAAFALQIGFGIGIGFRALVWPAQRGKPATPLSRADDVRRDQGRPADTNARARHLRGGADKPKPEATDTGSA